MTASLFVDAGGFAVKLVVGNKVLRDRIRTDFLCLLRPRKPVATIEVHTPASASPEAWKVVSGQALDGEGEYLAAFDGKARQGAILLTGEAQTTLALAGFIRRVFARWVTDCHGAVFHCACVVRGRMAYLFFGQSGSGKSTVCACSPDAIIASDDLTAIRSVKGRLLAWGLPTFQTMSNFRLSHGPFPVRAAFRLVQDRRHDVRRLGSAVAMAGLLGYPSDLATPGPIAKVVDLLARLVHDVPCYELHFQKNRRFWDAIDAELESPGNC